MVRAVLIGHSACRLLACAREAIDSTSLGASSINGGICESRVEAHIVERSKFGWSGLCCEIVVSVEDGDTGRLENGNNSNSLAWRRSRRIQLSGHVLV